MSSASPAAKSGAVAMGADLMASNTTTGLEGSLGLDTGAAAAGNRDLANAGPVIVSEAAGSGASQSMPPPSSSSSSSSAAATTIARAISPPTPAPSPQPTSNSIRLAQAHAHARAMAAAADAAAAASVVAGPSSALAHSFTAMPSTPPHQEDAKLGPAPGAGAGAGVGSSNLPSSDILSLDAQRSERTMESLHRHLVSTFPVLSRAERLAFLSALIPLSTTRELAHLQSLITPNLKVDFLSMLPYELSFHILSFIDDPVTLARCSAVSRQWRALVNDEGTWMALCKKHGRSRSLVPGISTRAVSFSGFGSKAPSPQAFSYKNHIKLAYLTDANWRRGGRLLTTHRSTSAQTVTSLAIDRDWIVVGMASSKIHVFDARTGLYYATLRGHETGVWALAMVSGSKPREAKEGPHRDAAIFDLDESKGNGISVDTDGDVAMDEPDNSIRSRLRPRRKSSTGDRAPGASDSRPSTSAASDTRGPSRTKNRIDQAHSAAELNKMIAGRASRRRDEGSVSGRPDALASGSAARQGDIKDDGDDLMDGSRSQSSFYDEDSSTSGTTPNGPQSSSDPRPYEFVGGNDELQLTYFDPTPCENEAYSYGDSNTPLPSPAASGMVPSSAASLFGTRFREHGARSVSAAAAPTSSITPTHHGNASSLLPHPNGLLGAQQVNLNPFGAGGPSEGPRYGLAARQQRESPSARQANQRVSFGVTATASSASDSSAPYASSSRRSLPADGAERLGLGRPSSSGTPHGEIPAASFGYDEVEAAEARAAWNAAGLPQTGNAIGMGNPSGSSASFGNEDAIIVSGSCDRDVRVWDVKTRRCKFVLRGHTSTVRCLKVLDGRPIAISGSRDTNVRIWNLSTGELQHLCVGHTQSVRCLEAAGNRVVSGSYDRTCRIWDVETGQCLHVLEGHHHYIYAVAFDGRRVATGSLDTTIRVWDADTGTCLSMFTGHTSLVGHLQLRDNILVSGGSDGRVIVFSLKTNECIHRLCAHDNSVTSLQFDDRFIVTGANDGRVKVWDFRTGKLLRELVEVTPGAVVWKVSFKDDKVVALYTNDEQTIMDVISFRPLNTQ